MTSCIYMITNLVDGKKYIGQTINYNKRKKTHFSRLRANTHHNEHLQRAFNKYGEKNFKIEILVLCSEEQLDDLEKYYIKKYDCCNPIYGYNLMDGGQKYRHFTDEVKEKMSKSGKGRTFTDEHKKRISMSNKGRKLSQESIEKMKRTKKTNMNNMGEKNPLALVSDNQAIEILIFYWKNEISLMELSKKFNVSYDIANNLINNRSYTHLLKEHREDIHNKKNNKIDKIRELYSKNYSQNKIAKMLKVSRNTIKKVISN